MELKPSEIFYSQSSIDNKFNRRTPHRGVLIGDTLDAICEGRRSVSSLPTITVTKREEKWVTHNNRRLWVLRHLERLGKCDTIHVTEDDTIHYKKLTSGNGGKTIVVRGDPGGTWWEKPSVVTIHLPSADPLIPDTNAEQLENSDTPPSIANMQSEETTPEEVTREASNEESDSSGSLISGSRPSANEHSENALLSDQQAGMEQASPPALLQANKDPFPATAQKIQEATANIDGGALSGDERFVTANENGVSLEESLPSKGNNISSEANFATPSIEYDQARDLSNLQSTDATKPQAVSSEPKVILKRPMMSLVLAETTKKRKKHSEDSEEA